MSVLRAHPSVRSKQLDDEQVLVHLDSGSLFALQGVGVRAWELLQEGTTPEALIEALLTEYRVERGRLERDVERLLDGLRRHALIAEQGRAPDVQA